MIVLASTSPRRKMLLSEICKEFVLVSSPYEEENNLDFDCRKLVEYLAEHKANAVEGHVSDAVIGADTVVDLDGKRLGKPENEAEARQMLSSLSGRKHIVWTGVCIRRQNENKVFSVKSEVFFKDLSQKEIDDYVATGSPFDKAGAYGVQDSGFVERIVGSKTNVMGFPVDEIGNALKQMKLI